MSKRGQITVFMILGFVIFALVVVIYSLIHQTPTSDIITAELSFEPVQSFIDSCLDQSSQRGLGDVLAFGGYYDIVSARSVLEFSADDKKLILPSYFDSGKIIVPSLDDIQTNAAHKIEDHFRNCIQSFEVFKTQGYVIEASEPVIMLLFNQVSTKVTLSYPVVVSKGDSRKEFSSFTVMIPYGFPATYSAVTAFLENQSALPNEFLVSGLSDVARSLNASFRFFQYGDEGEDVVVRFSDHTSSVLFYQFGLMYDWSLMNSDRFDSAPSSSSSSSGRSAIIMGFLPEWNITQNGVFRFTPDIKGQNLRYALDTTFLGINPLTGQITLDTSELPNDEYEFILTVTNQFNQSSSQPLYINVLVVNDSVPEVASITRQLIKANSEFLYPVTLIDSSSSYSFPYPSQVSFDVDAAPMFSIDSKTGVLRARPSSLDVGVYSVRVNAFTDSWNTWRRFEVEVQ